MANNTGWVAGRGVGVTYTSAGFTATDFNTFAAAAVVVATSAITNTTALDLYADVSFSFTNGATTITAAHYLSLYVLPLNQDASTYGDGAVTGTTNLPAAGYLVSSIGLKIGAASGATLVGTFRGILLPVGNFKFAVVNNSAAWNATAAAVVSYRTYNEQLNA